MPWTRWDERAATLTDEVAIEWWTVLVLRPRSDERIHFVERRTAEVYARFLLEETAPLVVLEHWRDTGRVAVELMGAAPED
ncbi:MAG TPA: hypothetical protein PKD59_13120 [Miltoncostaeaceae bacterium]|nr:hypothetical protein [Miltoncostaeaceae bacterium]